MALKNRKPRQNGQKSDRDTNEWRWLASDVRERGIATPWGARAWPKGTPDRYMPERDRALFLAGPAAGGTSICGMGGKVKALYRLWVDNRDEILAEFIKTHPGRRPRGFWLADAPPGGFDYLAEETAALTAQGGQPPHESQASFLRRHRLLMRGELERLTEDDFKPEAAVVIAYHQRGERLFGESIGLA